MRKTFRKFFSPAVFGRDDKGSIATIFGLTLIPVLALAGAAVDFSHALSARTKLSATVDAVTLAAGTGIVTPSMSASEQKAILQDYFDANWDPNLPKPTFDAQIADGRVTITAQTEVATTLLNVIGFKTLPVTASATSVTGITGVEVALVLDNTGSMGGSKIADLKVAANSLVDKLFALPNADELVKIGIVPFGQNVRIDTKFADARWLNRPADWSGCLTMRQAPYDLDERPTARHPAPGVSGNCSGIQTITPLTNSTYELHRQVQGLTANGMTYIPVGMSWGWQLLSPQGPYTGAAEYSDKKTKKYLVVMTDGANTINTHNANGRLQQTCEVVKDKDITVFSITFQVNDRPTKNLMRKCATSSSHYFNAESGGELKQVFDVIATEISRLRLSS